MLAHLVCRWCRAIQQVQRLRRPVLRQQVGGEVDPRRRGLRVRFDGAAQHGFGGVALPGQPQERPQITGRGRMTGRGPQGHPHRLAGRKNLARPVARDTEINPRIGEVRLQFRGSCKTILRLCQKPGGEIGDARHVMRLGHARRPQPAAPRRGNRAAAVAHCQKRGGKIQPGRRIFR